MAYSKTILAVIPARAGSKGIPNKNIRLLGSYPLIDYTISRAKESELITTCMVSTDSESYRQLAIDRGVNVPFLRPDTLATDATGSVEVLQHAVSFLEKEGQSFDIVCLLQPTSPFRLPGFIDRCISKFFEDDADSLFSSKAVPDHYNPHWVFEEVNGKLINACGDKSLISRRQLLPPTYIRDGSVYLVKKDILMNQNSLYSEKIAHFPSPEGWYVNLDTECDWKLAESMCENYLSKWPLFE